jgi:hypothetical protein
MGPSEPGTASATEGERPLGLGVRTPPRLVRMSGFWRWEELPVGLEEPGFLLAILTGATVECDTSWRRGLDELGGCGGESSMLR